jgi:uncharacterized membrane protein
MNQMKFGMEIITNIPIHHVWNAVCKSAVINMVTMQNSEVIYKVIISVNKICTSVIHSSQKLNGNNRHRFTGLEIYACGLYVLCWTPCHLLTIHIVIVNTTESSYWIFSDSHLHLKHTQT